MKPPKRSSAEYLALVGQLYKQPGGEDMSEEQTCEECRHWERVDTAIGECTAHPPTLVEKWLPPFNDQLRYSQLGDATIWPVTHGDDSCGEWMRRP